MPEETNLEYRDGLGTHGMKGTVIPGARRDAGIDDDGGRFDVNKPIAFNVVDLGPDGVERTAQVSPEDIMKMRGVEEISRFTRESGRAALAESHVVLNRGTPVAGGKKVEIVDADTGFEEPVQPGVMHPHAGASEVDLKKIAQEDRYMPPPPPERPSIPVPWESSDPPAPKVEPIILPAMGDKGAPAVEVYEKQGSVDLSKVPTPGAEPKSEFSRVEVAASLPSAGSGLMQASREKVRFVGAFGKLSVPYNMVWRHGFVLAMMQYSEDGIFYEPQDTTGFLEVWWRGNLFVCMPNVIYLPFPDGRISLSVFFVDEDETVRRREELGNRQRIDG